MYRASTPTFTITLPFSLSDVRDIICSFAQDDETILEKNMSEMVLDRPNRTITVTLSQEETLEFEEGSATYQLNVMFNDGKRLPSQETKFKVEGNLHDEVIEVEEEEV